MQAPHPRRLARAAEAWFARHQRPLPWRSTYDPYHVWVSEVMLQQTRMEVVLPYFDRFVTRFPTVADLAAASEDEVLAAWSGLGYYRRARMLRAGAAIVQTRFGGTVPSTPAALGSIPGIGRYTAGAIASIAWNRRAPIVDGNIARIVSRLFSIDAPNASPALMRQAWLRAEELVEACTSPRDFNQGLMEIGALICKPRIPECGRCPLSASCTARRGGEQDRFPRPKASIAARHVVVPLYLISDGEGRVLMQRENGPLMTAMYHLPHGSTSLLQSPPLQVERGEHLGTFRHSITSRRVEFQIFSARVSASVRERASASAWVDPADLHLIPHPSYVKKALTLVRAAR